MANQITWTAVILALGSILLTGTSTLLGIWLTNRLQLRTKQIELGRQATLKARELFFNSYEKQIERTNKHNEESGEILGTLAGRLSDIEGEETRQLAWQGFLEMIKFTIQDLVSWTNRLEIEFNEAHLLETNKGGIEQIRQRLATGFNNLKIEDKDHIVIQYMGIMSALHSLQNTLLTKKRDDLFCEYLPK
jgi:hypothetical protein